MQASTPPVEDEREGLMVFLAQQRCWVRAAAYGLDEGQARATPTRSALSVGGLVKHLTAVEQSWADRALGRAGPEQTGFEDFQAGFRLRPDETLAGTVQHYVEAAASDAAFASIDDLDQEVPVPPGWFWVPPEVKCWSVRWVLLHLVEETARHAGHADIIRECIDGAQSLPLMAALDGWPENEWLKPWSKGN
jgi:uncharacterized damage-inducible protein DinB